MTTPEWVYVGPPPVARVSIDARAAVTAIRPPPKRILVIKVADMGDALLATPALSALRAAYGEAQIDALVTPVAREALEGSGLIDHFLELDPRSPAGRGTRATLDLVPTILTARRRRYDMALLLHHATTALGSLKHAALVLACGAPKRVGLVQSGSRRGWFLTDRAIDPGFDAAHEVDAALLVAAAAGAAPAGTELVFRPGDSASRAAALLLSGLDDLETEAASHVGYSSPRDAPAPPVGRRGVVAIHPGTGAYSPARRWSADGFVSVARHAQERGWHVVLVGREGDATQAVRAGLDRPVLDLTGRTSLATLGAVLASVDAVVANDGGVSHLAAAMKTPVVAVFGPSNPVAWGPWPGGAASPHRVVALRLPCRPCFYVGHQLGAPDGCATRDCLRWLDEGWVIQALDEVMSARGSHV